MVKYLVLDSISFLIVYLGALYAIVNTLYVKPLYIELLLILICLRILTYFYYRKYSLPHFNLRSGLILIIWSNALIGFSTVFLLSVTLFSQIPRTFAIQIILYPFILDLIFVALKSRGEKRQRTSIPISINDVVHTLSITDSLIGFVSIYLSYFIITLVKYHKVDFYPETWNIILLLLPVWLLSVLFTQKYRSRNLTGKYLILGQHTKSTFIMVTLLSVLYYFLRLEYLSRILLFGTATLSGLIEATIAISRYMYAKSKNSHLHSTEDVFDEKGYLIQESLPIDSNITKYLTPKPVFDNLSKLIRAEDPFEINIFLENISKDISSFSKSFSLISASTFETIEFQSHNSILLNFHNCNDQRHLNKYLISCHRSLVNGGLLVGYFEPLSVVRKNLKNRLPRILFLIISPAHFIFHRIFPKMKLTSYLYFLITRGRNRIISKAEMFGRLSFCGFDILADISKPDKTAFIAQKTKSISSELKPSFRAIVRLKRIGYRGETINIYKFRTMHPYSEFLQKYVYDISNLDNKGKFKNDFRLTSWGKVFRKLWIDELPQLLNWVRGDVKLFGVRALSHQYYSLYPDNIKQLRIKTKPGLIPPFYVDLPKDLEEIVASEERYLNSYLKKPMSTDITYFFRALRNIIFKGSRSQ